VSYDKTIVKKPWGYEYLAYENDKVGLWFLYIAKDQQTSMHCHPNKTTGLILLDGEAELSFLSDSCKLKPVSKTMIRKGLFHSTKATSDNGAFVFEIETPVQKHDLVRLEDKYGREGKPYEDSTFETPKQEDCFWIENLSQNTSKEYNFANCNIKVEKIDNINILNQKTDSENIMFLDGGIVTTNGDMVAQAGDIVSGKIIKKLIKLFPTIDKNTMFMTIRKNND
jgi:mannose-6-phosphate isomerase-like protein (cupin superfamily)|tara:strand:- start:1867 stop:2541 length:675 start_codon:yes stop_codon:yes gene_type:complete